MSWNISWQILFLLQLIYDPNINEMFIDFYKIQIFTIITKSKFTTTNYILCWLVNTADSGYYDIWQSNRSVLAMKLSSGVSQWPISRGYLEEFWNSYSESLLIKITYCSILLATCQDTTLSRYCGGVITQFDSPHNSGASASSIDVHCQLWQGSDSC